MKPCIAGLAFVLCLGFLAPIAGQDASGHKKGDKELSAAEKDQKALFAVYGQGIEVEIGLAENPVKLFGRIDGVVEVFGRRFLRLQNAGKSILVNPDRIAFIVNR